jgi:hypothetical protein
LLQQNLLELLEKAMTYSTKDIAATLPKHPTKKPVTRALSAIKRIVLHTTDDDCSIKGLNKYDISPGNHISITGCPTYTYHETIMPDDIAYHTLDWTIISWHVGAWNPSSLGVAMMYKSTDKDGDAVAPSDSMLQLTIKHLSSMCLTLGMEPKNIVGHRELLGTGHTIVNGKKVYRKTCPGTCIDMDDLRIEVAKVMQYTMREAGVYNNIVDGIFGKNSIAALKKYKETH